jgi:hypothetical protein
MFLPPRFYVCDQFYVRNSTRGHSSLKVYVTQNLMTLEDLCDVREPHRYYQRKGYIDLDLYH